MGRAAHHPQLLPNRTRNQPQVTAVLGRVARRLQLLLNLKLSAEMAPIPQESNEGLNWVPLAKSPILY
jgi:hypothetical protein